MFKFLPPLEPNNPGWDIICVWIESVACLGETCQLSLPTTQSRGNGGSEENVPPPVLCLTGTFSYFRFLLKNHLHKKVFFLITISNVSSSNRSITWPCLFYFLNHKLSCLFIFVCVLCLSFPNVISLWVGILSILFISVSPEIMTILGT